MNWELLLKAKMTLPQANKDSWLEILATEESITQFMRRLRSGQYQTQGIMRTLTFLRDENSDNNLENYASIDYDEEEIVRRFQEYKPNMLKLLTNKVNRIKGVQVRAGREQGENVRIENEKQIFDRLDELVAANPSNVKVDSNWGRNLLAIEETLKARPKLVSRLRNKLVAKYGNFFSEWPIPGIAGPTPSIDNPLFAEGGNEPQYLANPAYQAEWWEGNNRKLKTLIGIFKGGTPPTKRYTANTLDAELTHTYYSSIGKWHNLLIPDELQDADLFISTKKLKLMNPNLLLLIKENEPFTKVSMAAHVKYTTKVGSLKYGFDREYHTKKEKDIEAEAHQAILRELSGKGIVFRKEGYDELVELKNELVELEEEARQSDGSFSKEKQRDLKLLETFFNSGTHRPFDYKDKEYYEITIPISLRRKIDKLYQEEGYNDDYELDEDLKSSLKIPEQYKNTQDALATIDLDNLTGDPESDLTMLNLLNTIKEADEALDLDSFSENTSEEFDKSIKDIRETIIQLTQEKVQDIVQNPTNYRKIKPIKSAEFITEQGVTFQGKREVTIFDALVNKNIIEEVGT